MSKEAPEIVDESQPDTSTETDDAPVSAETDAPEASKEEPTEKSDADSGQALDDKPEKKPIDQELAKKSYDARESKRVRELRQINQRLLTMMENQRSEKDEPQAPKVEDYEKLDEYVSATVQYELQQGKETAPKTSEDDAVFNQKGEDLTYEGSLKYEDFAEKVIDVQLSRPMADAILEFDDMDTQVELAYALGNSPKEVRRIERLSPLRQVAEIGKLEEKLTAPKPAKRQPSTAPAPINPVGGSNTPNSEHQPGDDMKTFIAKRAKELGR